MRRIATVWCRAVLHGCSLNFLIKPPVRTSSCCRPVCGHRRIFGHAPLSISTLRQPWYHLAAAVPRNDTISRSAFLRRSCATSCLPSSPICACGTGSNPLNYWWDTTVQPVGVDVDPADRRSLDFVGLCSVRRTGLLRSGGLDRPCAAMSRSCGSHGMSALGICRIA